MFTTKKIAIVSVINDLATDSRVNRICLALTESGYEVHLIGRRLPNSLALPNWPFKATRMQLLFKKGPAFYLFYNLRLFLLLLFKKCHLLYANDLDTLAANYMAAKIRGLPLIYDSHELFCEVPELQNSKLKRRVWKSLESFTIPKLKHCITVNDSIASIFEKEYGVKFKVVRNIPDTQANFVPKTRTDLGLPVDRKIVLMQGAGINVERGAEELTLAMEQVNGAVLYIIGGGDVWDVLKRIIIEKNLQSKVKLINKMPKPELMHYTFNADLGVSIDRNTNLNYRYSLPNKLFDYLQAGLPVLISRLPEPEKIVKEYEVGEVLDDHQPSTIAKKINAMLSSEKMKVYRANTSKVTKAFNWHNEKQKLLEVIAAAGTRLFEGVEDKNC